MEPASVPTDRRISHYRVVASLGQGGMGEVYAALDITRSAGLQELFTGKPAYSTHFDGGELLQRVRRGETPPVDGSFDARPHCAASATSS